MLRTFPPRLDSICSATRDRVSPTRKSFRPQTAVRTRVWTKNRAHKLNSLSLPAFEYVLTTNERLTNVTEDFESATVVHSTIEVDGYGGLTGFLRLADSADDRPELNVKEIRPPRMDDSGRTKYPVLFRV